MPSGFRAFRHRRNPAHGAAEEVQVPRWCRDGRWNRVARAWLRNPIHGAWRVHTPRVQAGCAGLDREVCRGVRLRPHRRRGHPRGHRDSFADGRRVVEVAIFVCLHESGEKGAGWYSNRPVPFTRF